MLLTSADERTTPTLTYYSLGSYRASTSIAALSTSDLQQEILDLGALRNQLVHTPSVFVTQATFDGVQPISATLAIPGREYLPNQVEMGGIAETFVAGTARSVPAIGAAAGVSSHTTTQATCLPVTATSATCNVSIPLFDWKQQFTTVWPFLDISQHPLPEVPLDFNATLGGKSSGTRTSASVASSEVGAKATTFVELRLDTVPGLRKHLRRLISQRRSKLRRVLKRRRAVTVRAPRPRPARRNLALALLAVSYRFGRRGESDDHALPAHRSTPVIGREPALSC